MKWTLERRALLTGCLVLVLLLVIGSAQYATIQKLVHSLEWVTHTVGVGEQVGKVQDALSASAAEARRFVTTGDASTLESYSPAVKILWTNFEELSEMVADNPNQQARIARLRPLLERRIHTLDHAIAQRQGGGSSAAVIGDLDRVALAETDPIRRIADEIRDEEGQLRAKRQGRAETNQRRAMVLLAMGSLFAVGVVVWGAIALHRDVAERNRAEEALRSSQGELRDLSGRLLKLQDEERRRLARELHDGVSQIVTAVQLRLATLEICIPPENQPAHAELAELSGLMERCGREIRTLSHLLHPPVLDHIGVASAIRWFVEGFSERSGIKVEVQAEEEHWPRFSADTETTLFRITQEALTNIHRHSGSSTARIQASLLDGHVRLEISDDGRGIPADVLNSPARLGVGIRGMTERVRLLGGKLSIESSERGTTVRADLPAEGRQGDQGPA
jgi:signal transduction histidine kinase